MSSNEPWISPRVFASREDHLAAFETARRLEARGFPLAKDLTPSLAKTAAEIAATARAIVASGHKWARIECAWGDPRTPHRDQDRNVGACRQIDGVGWLVTYGIGPGKGYQAGLFTEVGSVAEHVLVHRRSGRRVAFDSLGDATWQLDGVVNADGGLPREWAWSPSLGAEGVQWVPDLVSLRNGGNLSSAALTWRGQRHYWLILPFTGEVLVYRDREPVWRGHGVPLAFTSIKEAKLYCVRGDAC
jgi:hypothetical protein